MNYFDTLKNRSVFLRHILFASRQRGAANLPVHIDRAPLPQGAAAQEDAAQEITARESDAVQTDTAAQKGGAQQTDMAHSRSGQAEKKSAGDEGAERPEAQTGRPAWEKESALDVPPGADMMPSAPMEAGQTAAKQDAARQHGDSARILRGVDAARKLLQAMRETNEAGEQRVDAPREEMSLQRAASEEPRNAAAILWEQLRGAESGAVRAAQQAASAPQNAAPAAPAAGAYGQAADWSACFEQDARRYDGTHPLY